MKPRPWVSLCVILEGCRAALPAEPAPPGRDPAPVDASRGDLVYGPITLMRDGADPAESTGPTPAGEASEPVLDKYSIRAVVRSHLPEITRCYSEGLAVDPTLAGRVEIEFTIGPEGDVTDALVRDSDLPDDAASVQVCILSEAQAWHFPSPPGGGNAVVTYPFVLEPDEPAPTTDR